VLKYDALAALLCRVDAASVRYSFTELSVAIPGGLPASAYTQPAWWDNRAEHRAQARAWLAAGWAVGELDLDARVVMFARLPRAGRSAAPAQLT